MQQNRVVPFKATGFGSVREQGRPRIRMQSTEPTAPNGLGLHRLLVTRKSTENG